MMSEYTTVKSDCVVKLPDDTTDWASAVIEPNCCVVNLLNTTNIQAGDHVVLVGAGYMGTMTLQGLTRGLAGGPHHRVRAAAGPPRDGKGIPRLRGL